MRIYSIISMCIISGRLFAAGIEGFFDFDEKYAGTTTFNFLKNPVGARTVAMGGHTITIDEEATTVFWNPAGLVNIPDYWYSFSHMELFGEVRQEYLAATIPTRESGTIGINANVFTSGAMDGRSFDDYQERDFSQIDLALGVSYGIALLNRRLALGIGANLLRSTLADRSAVGYGINLGSQYYFSGGLRVGLTIHNLSHGTRYNTSTGPIEPIPQMLTAEIGRKTEYGKWSWNFGTSRNNEGSQYVYGGLEREIKKLFFLRGGYEKTLNDDELEAARGLCLGLGVKFRELSVDYGIKLFQPLGDINAVTVSYAKKGKGPLGERELMLKAKAKYKEKQYEKSHNLLRRVLTLNPTNWEAISLLAKINQELERMYGNSLTIFYTGNSLGKAASVQAGGQTMGGLARRQTKLKELKDQYPHSILLDAGQVTSDLTDVKYARLIYQAYGRMSYDAANLTVSEHLKGNAELQRASRMQGMPWVASNARRLAWKNEIKNQVNLKTFKGVRVNILGAVAADRVPSPLREELHVSRVVEAVRQLQWSWQEKPDVLVLLLQGTLGLARTIAQNLSDIDVIILTGENEEINRPVVFGKTIVVSPAKYGTHIGGLSLNFTKSFDILSYSHFLVPLDRHVASDPIIDQILSKVIAKFDSPTLKVHQEEANIPVFAFINSDQSKRKGVLYLKDTKTNLVYRMTDKKSQCYQPVIAPLKKRVAYICDKDNGTQVVYTQRLKSEAAVSILGKDSIGVMSWGPWQQWLYYTSRVKNTWDLYRTDATGSQVENITKGQVGLVHGFNVSPQGERLAIQALDYGREQIWVSDMDMKNLLKITTGQVNGFLPKWSPDGRKLGYISNNPQEGDFKDLEIMDLNTGGVIKVTESSLVQEFLWSGKGDWIYYSSGVNIMDLSAYHLDSAYHRKLIENYTDKIASELNPVFFQLNGRAGILFESVSTNSSHINWVDLEARRETPIVKLPGYNYLR